MPLRPTTREQVAGHGFVVQRARRALVGADIAERSDRLATHSRAAVAGAAVAAILVAGAAVLAFLRPAPDVGAMSLVQVEESGALLVNIEGRFHPVPNLASARLVLGEPARPERVPEESVLGRPRGPILGIPGAPPLLPSGPVAAGAWAVCDAEIPESGGVATSVVHAGGVAPAPWAPGEAMLATSAGQSWLVVDGRRARIDPGDPVLAEVLGLGALPHRELSTAALELLPESPPVAAVEVPGAGTPSRSGPREMRVGEVFAVEAATGTEYFLVLADGVQRIGPVAADLLRATGEGAGRVALPVLAPSEVPARVVEELDLSHLPARVPSPARASAPLTCVWWTEGGDGVAPRAAVSSAESISDVTPIAPAYLSSADAGGPRVDAVAFPAGGLVVRPVSSAGTPAGDASVVLTDGGVAHGVPEPEAAAALGLPGPAEAVPARLVERFPRGPELRLSSARIAFDTADPAVADPVALEAPG